MTEEFELGTDVEITYESQRSGNVLSRTGTVVQVPREEDKTVLFVETDDNQLTAVKSDYAFSLSITDDADAEDKSRVQRTTPLGRVESVTSS